MNEAEQKELEMLEAKSHFRLTVGDTKRMDELRALAATACPTAICSLRDLIEDELRDLWQFGYDREPREESVQPRLDAIMQIIEANSGDLRSAEPETTTN